ncbi:MAG TPA: hypothetical protein VF438_03825, partial [Candidatus Paceibacterota bacterium]
MEPVNKNHQFVGAAIAVILLLVGIVAYSWMSRSSSPTADTSQQQVSAVSTNIFAWQELNLDRVQPIRTTDEIPVANDKLVAYKIADITSGSYKGDILALVGWQNEIDSYHEGASGIYFANYFIADAQGNAVAWDARYVGMTDTWCNGYGEPNCERTIALKNIFGLTDKNQTTLDSIPIEFGAFGSIHSKDKQAIVVRNTFGAGLLSVSKLRDSKISEVDHTAGGLPIFMSVGFRDGQGFYGKLPQHNYYIKLPFGAYVPVVIDPGVTEADGRISFDWTTGTTTRASYKFGEFAYGWQDCYDGLTTYEEFTSHLVKTAPTAYELPAASYPEVYKCLFEKTRRYVYDPITQSGTYQDTDTYANFIQSHPMFFVQNVYGEWVGYLRSDVVPPAEKAKPVIYLYPPQTEQVSVHVSPVGGFTKTDPDYGTGWNVIATPEGTLTTATGVAYPYLFWEGGKEGSVVTPREGFIVARADIADTLDAKLSEFGLNKQERSDFIDFWSPKLSRAPYCFITFISRSEIDRVAPMNIAPTPDS